MKITSINNQNFGLLFMPQANIHAVQEAVPAIVRTVKQIQIPSSLPQTRFFTLHEAIVTDPRIKVVGIPQKTKHIPFVKKMRNTGRNISDTKRYF